MTRRQTKNNQQQQSSLGLRLRNIIIGLYSVVIVGIGIGLYALLQQEKLQNETIEMSDTKPDPEVLAVFSTMEGSEVTVPIGDLEKVMPEEPEPAWLEYAVSWNDSPKPRIAIVIDDLGLSHQATRQLAEMPGPYTLAFLPYAENLPAQTSLMHEVGHELMVHMPMEPKAKSADPGTNALLKGLPQDEFARRLDWNLDRFEGFVGVNNHMGSLLTEEAGPMVRVMMQLKEKGYLFLDSLTSPDTVGIRAAKATGVPSIARDIFLDNIQHRKAIEDQLAKLERIARLRGYAIAIGHPYSVTLETLADWRNSLSDKGLVLVPISQLVAQNEKVPAKRLENLEQGAR